MGLVEQIKCKQCGAKKDVFTGTNCITQEICNECENKKEVKEKEEYFEFLNSLSLEERIRKIEIWIFENEPKVRKAITKIGIMDRF